MSPFLIPVTFLFEFPCNSLPNGLGCDIFLPFQTIDAGLTMSFNLSLLPSEEKNEVEIDKQASFLVWKIKQAQAGPEVLVAHKSKLKLESEVELF